MHIKHNVHSHTTRSPFLELESLALWAGIGPRCAESGDESPGTDSWQPMLYRPPATASQSALVSVFPVSCASRYESFDPHLV